MSRILIVEDDLAIAVALEDDLRLEGYSVDVVRDGEAAIQHARRGAFDLILLDVMLVALALRTRPASRTEGHGSCP